MSTLTLWALIITTVVIQSEIGYCLLIATAALGSLWEYFWLLKVGAIPRHWHIGYVAGIALLLGNFYFLHNLHSPEPFFNGSIFAFDATILVVTIIVLFLREFVSLHSERNSAEGIAFTLLGIIYIPWLFSFVVKLIYLLPRDAHGVLTGTYYVLFLLVVTKFTDVGAFVFGSLFGKHLFVPHISPKKTWEGILGALVVAVLSGWGFFTLFKKQLFLLNLPTVLVISLILGLAAIAGDLAESLLKRALHTKDSSATLPGIGGGLDLIDSVLFTAPLFYFIMQLLLP